MFAYFLETASHVWQDEIKNINTITGFLDPNLNSSVLDLHQSNFQFGFGFVNTLPKEIGSLKLQYVEKSNFSRSSIVTTIPLV